MFQHGEIPPPAVLYLRVHPLAVEDVLTLALQALARPCEGRFVVVTRDGLRTRAFDDVLGR